MLTTVEHGDSPLAGLRIGNVSVVPGIGLERFGTGAEFDRAATGVGTFN